jgi:hypothetical protein
MKKHNLAWTYLLGSVILAAGGCESSSDSGGSMADGVPSAGPSGTHETVGATADSGTVKGTSSSPSSASGGAAYVGSSYSSAAAGGSSSSSAAGGGTYVFATGSSAAAGGAVAMPTPTDGTGGSTGTVATKPVEPTPTPVKTGAGTLTAGTWDDNQNFSFYLNYLDKTSANLEGRPLIERRDLMVIKVTAADGMPLAGATVKITSNVGKAFTSITGTDGRVLYFPTWSGVAADQPITIQAIHGNSVVTQSATATAGTLTVKFAETASALPTVLDLVFLLDNTSSMSDETSYLKAEMDNIVNQVSSQFPDVKQRWALIVYRDHGDTFVVKPWDFTDSLSTFRQTLAAQSAQGGGDTPEAVDEALTASTKLSWSTGAAARIMFWIADAPHHVGLESGVIAALGTVIEKGVHIYPVASSGADDLAEYTMRTAAQVTGGRYLFLTDDSGVGGSHQEPHLPCYFVTTLESAMRRMIAYELTGTYNEPAASEIIRTGGDPQSRQCTLTNGDLVEAW